MLSRRLFCIGAIATLLVPTLSKHLANAGDTETPMYFIDLGNPKDEVPVILQIKPEWSNLDTNTLEVSVNNTYKELLEKQLIEQRENNYSFTVRIPEGTYARQELKNCMITHIDYLSETCRLEITFTAGVIF